MGVCAELYAVPYDEQAAIEALIEKSGDEAQPAERPGWLTAPFGKRKIPAISAVFERILEKAMRETAEALEMDENTPIRFDAQPDKAHDVIQKAVALLVEHQGVQPSAIHAIEGSKLLHAGGDGVILLNEAKDVADIVAALDTVDEGAFMAVRDSACQTAYYGEAFTDEELFKECVWDAFDEIRRLYRTAADQRRCVVMRVA